MDKWLKSGTLKIERARFRQLWFNNSHSTRKKILLKNKRKYTEEYSTVRFIEHLYEEWPVCHDILSNESVEPAKVRTHLQTKARIVHKQTKGLF